MPGNTDTGSSVDPERWYPNPSFGLSLWGPLVPANDCKSCLGTLAAIQFAAGACLFWIPGRRPPVGRSKWANRGLRTMGIFSGTYLMFFAAIESVRLLLPYDPWVEDARVARKNTAGSPKAGGWPRWLGWWLGPQGYRAVPFDEWRHRVDNGLQAADPERVSAIQREIAVMANAHQQLREHNRSTAQRVVELIDKGAFEPKPLDPDEVVEIDTELDLDDLEFAHLDMWARFVNVAPFSMVLIPRSTPLKRDDDPDATEFALKIWYSPVPAVVQRL